MSGTSEAARLAAVMVPWASEATRIAEKTIGPPLDLFDPTSQHQIDLAYYLMVLGLIALYGPGAFSLDSLVVRTLLRRFPELDGMRTVSYEGTPRVVIVGVVLAASPRRRRSVTPAAGSR